MGAYHDLEEILARVYEEPDFLPRKQLPQMYNLNKQSIEVNGLQLKEEDYLEIIDSSSEGSFIRDLVRGEAYYSAQWKKRLGIEHLPPQEAYEAALKRVHPDDVDGIKNDFWQACKYKDPKVRMTFRIHTVDVVGYIWILARGKIIYDPLGNPIKYYGTYMDITEFRKADEEKQALLDMLNMEKNKLMELVNNIPDEIWYFDQEQKLTLANPKAIQDFGITEQEDLETLLRQTTIYQSDYTLRPFADSPVHKAMRGECVNGQEEIVYLPATNQLQYRKVYGSPAKDQAGNIIGAVMIVHDVTQQKKAEKALKEEEEAKAFLLYLNDTLRMIKEPHKVQQIASALLKEYLCAAHVHFAKIYDRDEDGFAITMPPVTPSEQANRALIDLLGHFSSEDFKDPINVLQNGQAVVIDNVETSALCSEKAREFYRIVKKPSFVAVPLVNEGRLVWVLSVVSNYPRVWTMLEVKMIQEVGERTWDIMERCRAEIALKESEKRAIELVGKLRQADQNKNQFLNMLSHELRNPLTAIMMTQSLLENLAEQDDHDKDVVLKAKKVVQRQVKQLSHLVDDLLDVTRITQNKLVLKKEYLILNDIVKQVVADFYPQFVEKGVALQADIDTGRLYLQVDPIRMNQVLDNLLHNALKFTDAGDQVRVSLKKDETAREAVIEVIDNGKGIDPAIINNLFEPFIQAEQSLARSEGGLGLGLAIVKGMVELHGGRVAVFSEGLAKGTKFTICLPIDQASADTGIDERNQKVDSTSTGSKRILVIDDIGDIADVLCSLLEILGHEVRSATSGTEGIRLAGEFLPDIVICDLGLPDINGYEVVQKIKNQHHLKDAFFIALSGYAQPDDIMRTKEAGFDSHVAKPIDLDMLKKILSKI